MRQYIPNKLRNLMILIIVFSACVSVDNKVYTGNCTSGWTITSYWINDENFYVGPKIEAYDKNGGLIGRYKSDFLEQVRIDALGKGDGTENNGGIINYNFDGSTYRLTKFAEDIYEGPMQEWETLALNPPLSKGTPVTFKDLGGANAADWVKEKLLNNMFLANDIIGVPGKRIDVFVGMQDAPAENGSYNSDKVFKLENATVCIG